MPATNNSAECPGLLHLSGSDFALSGAWAATTICLGNYYSAAVTGDAAGGRLRLNFAMATSAATMYFLVDAVIAADGKNASGTVSGSPANFGQRAVTMAMQ
jgi:hypothetical protein